MVRALTAKAAGPGLDPWWLPWVFSPPAAWLTHVDGMKDLWCSSTVRHRMNMAKGLCMVL